jgi:molybdopterin-containing oxidoreductase family iron-sulfur binding subunit
LSKEKLLNIDFKGNHAVYPLALTTYHPVLDIRNGNQNYPWAQEIFLVMHGYGWKNFVEMNSDDADKRGIKDGDMVRVKSEFGEVVVKARVFEGIMPGVVAIAIGQGHYYCGEWADGIGVNPNEVIGIDYDEESGQASFRNTRVQIEKV